MPAHPLSETVNRYATRASIQRFPRPRAGVPEAAAPGAAEGHFFLDSPPARGVGAELRSSSARGCLVWEGVVVVNAYAPSSPAYLAVLFSLLRVAAGSRHGVPRAHPPAAAPPARRALGRPSPV